MKSMIFLNLTISQSLSFGVLIKQRINNKKDELLIQKLWEILQIYIFI
jgi:hypothetical protein